MPVKLPVPEQLRGDVELDRAVLSATHWPHTKTHQSASSAAPARTNAINDSRRRTPASRNVCTCRQGCRRRPTPRHRWNERQTTDDSIQWCDRRYYDDCQCLTSPAERPYRHINHSVSLVRIFSDPTSILSAGYCSLLLFYVSTYYYYYYNCFTALWMLSGTTRVSRHQKEQEAQL